MAPVTDPQTPLALRFSRSAAVAFGVFLVAIETWRRAHPFGDIRIWPSIFDDYLAGGFLVAAATVARREDWRGRAWLAGAWGAATGMMYGSFFGQLVHLAEPDPSGVGATCVVVTKGFMFALCLAGLLTALRSPLTPS